GIEVMSLCLVDEVEPGADHRHAFDAAAECAALVNRCESLLEGEVDAERRVRRETAVAVKRGLWRAPFGLVPRRRGCCSSGIALVFREHARAKGQQIRPGRLA